MSLVLHLPRDMHLSRSSSSVPRLPSFLEMLQNLTFLLNFGKVQNPLRLPHKTTSEPSKVVRACGAFNVLTWKCASRHTARTFSTCQLPKVLRRCCALCVLTWKCASRHNGVHFFDISTSKSGLRPSVFFTLLTSTSASRHKGVQLFISHLTRWLRTRRFSEPTFRPSGATKLLEKQCFATFLPFHAPASSFF